jgi:signal transduction histidine kinase
VACWSTPVRIGTRLTLTTSLLVAATLSAYSIISIRSRRTDLEAQLEEQARQIAAPLRAALEAERPTAWPPEASEINDALAHAEGPWRVQLLDASGLPPADAPATGSAQIERLRRMVALRSAIVDVTEVSGRPTFVYLEPVRAGTLRVLGAVEIARDTATLDSAVHDDALRTLIWMALLIATIFLTIFISTRRGISRPIAKLIAGIDDVAKGDLSHVLLAEREDEIGALAARFNEMTQSLRDARAETRQEVEERLALEAHLRDTSQLATIGQLAAEIAHEVGTPLNVVTGRARAMAKKADDPEAVRKNASIVAEQAGRITRIIQRLLDVARRKVGASERADVDLNRLATDTLELLEYQLGSARIEARSRLDREIGAVPGNRDQLQQVLLNLYMNAIQAMPGGGTLEVRTRRVARRRPGLEVDPERRYAVIEVADSGSGISEKDRAKIFEPFYTSRAGSGGTGLGLSVAHGIVKDHDGWIEIDDHGQRPGTVFRVFLPEAAG